MKARILLILITAAFLQVRAQLHLPEESPAATVTQRVGLTDITVSYHSPAVKGRVIWGSLVPYGQVWRAGANQNTVISFTHEVTIEGQKLPAGNYGLHMIPGNEEWTIIFSKNYTSWGSFFYNQKEDAARIKVKPHEHAFTEWLSYSFPQKTASSATMELTWEKLTVPVKIEVDVKTIVLASIKNELRNTPGFTWEGYYEAANYCYNNGIEYEQAMKWVKVAERSNSTFIVLRLKSELYAALGKKDSADIVMRAALAVADERDINLYGYELMNQGKTKEATEVFKTNVKKYPSSWNVYDSYGEALALGGNKNEALKQYETALKKAPEDQKERIRQAIQTLK